MSIQFSYYRNIHASHMILTPALEGEPWEKEMLWRNRPRELILPEYNSRNGQTQLWYDITGKQAVDMLAEVMRYLLKYVRRLLRWRRYWMAC